MSRKSQTGSREHVPVPRWRLRIYFQVVTGGLLVGTWPLPTSGQPTLAAIEETIAATYTEIGETSASELAAALASADSGRYVIFDSRPKSEFSQSHLRTAIRVDPDATTESFFAAHDESIRNKRLVFYCSVGYRSSILASRLKGKAIERGASSVANLRGGLFRWYNEGRPVFNGSGPTDDIHPYDKWWGRLVRQRESGGS